MKSFHQAQSQRSRKCCVCCIAVQNLDSIDVAPRSCRSHDCIFRCPELTSQSFRSHICIFRSRELTAWQTPQHDVMSGTWRLSPCAWSQIHSMFQGILAGCFQRKPRPSSHIIQPQKFNHNIHPKIRCGFMHEVCIRICCTKRTLEITARIYASAPILDQFLKICNAIMVSRETAGSQVIPVL